MRFEFHTNGTKVGSVQWMGPGQIRLDVGDPTERDFLTTYFSDEVTYLSTAFDEDDEALQTRRRDWTPWEFQRACLALAKSRRYRVHLTPSEPVDDRTATGATAAGRAS